MVSARDYSLKSGKSQSAAIVKCLRIDYPQKNYDIFARRWTLAGRPLPLGSSSFDPDSGFVFGEHGDRL